MLSFLKQRHSVLTGPALRAQLGNAFLVWEPGVWRPAPPSGSTLVVRTEPNKGAQGSDAMTFLLAGATDRLSLGREPDSDVCLDDGTVSKRHAELLHHEPSWFVRSASATNGSFINDVLAPQATNVPLRDGDRIRAGQVVLTFHDAAGLARRLQTLP